MEMDNIRVKIGLIGAGWSAKNITKAIAALHNQLLPINHSSDSNGYQNIELYAISNHNEEKASELANLYLDMTGKARREMESSNSAVSKLLVIPDSAPIIFKNYRDLLDLPEIDFVIISLPHFLLAPVGLEALKAGKHVLIEKPMAMSIEDAKKLIKMANSSKKDEVNKDEPNKDELNKDEPKRNKINKVHNEKGLQLGVYFQNRFNDSTLIAKEIVESGILGKIIQVRCELFLKRDPEYFSKSNWRGHKDREGGGVLINQSIHEIDKIRFLLGDYDPESIHGFLGTLIHPIDVEDNAVFSFKLENGAFGTFQASISVKTPRPPILRIYGSDTSMDISATAVKLYKSRSLKTLNDILKIPFYNRDYIEKMFSAAECNENEYFYAEFKKRDESMGEFKLHAHKRIITAFINKIFNGLLSGFSKTKDNDLLLHIENFISNKTLSENEILASGVDALKALEVIFKLYSLNE